MTTTKDYDKLIKDKGEALKPLIEAELGKRSFYEFFKLCCPVLYPGVDWMWNWHFKYVCDLLDDAAIKMINKEEKEHDFIFNLPFRSGKSILINVMYPVWLWVKNPNLSIISVSSTEFLSTKFSHASKMLIESPYFQERWGHIFKLRSDSKSKGDYLNDKLGRRSAFGINSGILGHGSDVLIMDDPQTPSDITDLALTKTIQIYQDSLYSRLDNPKTGFRVLLQQRLAIGDISSWMMENNPEGYMNVVIPATLTNDLNPKELSQYYQNNLFWEERFSQKVLDNFKKTLRSSMYAGQLLQRPTLEEGDMIKRNWFKKIPMSSIVNERLVKFLVIDTAFTSNQVNDPSSIMLATKHKNHIIILKIWQKWMNFNDLLNFIQEVSTNHNPARVLIESTTSGISIIQELRRQTTLPVIPIPNPVKDKVSRVQGILPALESGRVMIVEDDWNTDFLNQCANFPYDRHDDMVDTLVYACTQINSGGITKFF